MVTGKVLALMGVALAAVDFSGAAGRIELAIRNLMLPLKNWGSTWFHQDSSLQWWLQLIGVLSIVPISAVIAFEWYSGITILPGYRNELWSIALFIFMLAVLLVILTTMAGVAGLGLWAFFWLLAWPRRGILSALGLVIAVVALGYEFVK